MGVANISELVNKAYAQYIGKSDIELLTLKEFCDIGSDEATFSKSLFTKALIDVVTKNFFTDTSYANEYTDLFYEDVERFGAITQMIHVEAPEAKENSAWKTFTSGTSTVGNYTVYLPVVETQYYVKSSSWAVPVSISWEQWDTAFRDEESLNSFVNYVFLSVDNAIKIHLEEMDNLNRNNFIAEKIEYNRKADRVGTHVVDLAEEYAKAKGITEPLSRDSLMLDREFLNFAAMTLDNYIGYFKKPTSLFNTKGCTRFTPEDRLVCQVLQYFESAMGSFGYANTFHENYVKLPLHQSIPWVQSPGDLSLDDISSLHVETENGVVETSGIVAFIADKWSIMHTIRSNRVASQYFDIENITNYEYQHRDSYLNNLSMNAVVFVINDYPGNKVKKSK